MNSKVNEFLTICKSINLSFNTEKTKAIYLAKGSKKKIDIKIENDSISQVEKIKLLGRMINSSLTVGEHYGRVLSDCRNDLT